MAARAHDPHDLPGRKRHQLSNDREKLALLLKHDGLQRNTPAGQVYVVRGVFIDGGGAKRFCVRAVDSVPEFDNPATVIENDVALGADFHTAGLTLTDKELTKDLAVANKEQEEDRRLANPANAENLARVPAPAPAVAVLRHGRRRYPDTRVASSDTEEDDVDEVAFMREYEEAFAEPGAGLGAGEVTPRADDETAQETHLPLRAELAAPGPPAPEPPAPDPPAPEPPAPEPLAPERPAIVDNQDEGDFMEDQMWSKTEVHQLAEDSDPEWDDPSKDYADDPSTSFKPLDARKWGETTAKMRVHGGRRHLLLPLPSVQIRFSGDAGWTRRGHGRCVLGDSGWSMPRARARLRLDLDYVLI
jgi:hypothetical protein